MNNRLFVGSSAESSGNRPKAGRTWPAVWAYILVGL